MVLPALANGSLRHCHCDEEQKGAARDVSADGAGDSASAGALCIRDATVGNCVTAVRVSQQLAFTVRARHRICRTRSILVLATITLRARLSVTCTRGLLLVVGSFACVVGAQGFATFLLWARRSGT